jgi:16S rRNA processing protein RimM
LEGFDNREDLSNLANCWVVARREELPEPKEGCVYSFDLIGARVETKEGRDLGTVTDLFETAAHHVIQVETNGGKEFLVPLTREVDADLRFASEPGQSNKLVIHLPEGMEEATETPEKRERPSRELEDKRRETC